MVLILGAIGVPTTTLCCMGDATRHAVCCGRGAQGSGAMPSESEIQQTRHLLGWPTALPLGSSLSEH